MPTPADLKTRYPEFDGVPDARVQAFIEEAGPGAGESWFEADRTPGILALAAHGMAMEGEPGRSADPGAPVDPMLMGIPVERRTVGDVTTVWQGGSATNRGGSAQSEDGRSFAKTPYGRRYLELLRRNVGGPRVA